jgi:hypothetical protein
VAAFGLPESLRYKAKRPREQVDVLYCSHATDGENPFGISECAIDLCKHSKPYQVVVALVEPKSSLSQTLEHVRDQVEETKQFRDKAGLGQGDVLEVPEMVWRIDHRFLELIGKRLANVNQDIVEALQIVEFRLDRSGARVESDALMATKRDPSRFVFDRPFLVYMQKRGAEHPFFVMWVDNAELLVPR